MVFMIILTQDSTTVQDHLVSLAICWPQEAEQILHNHSAKIVTTWLPPTIALSFLSVMPRRRRFRRKVGNGGQRCLWLFTSVNSTWIATLSIVTYRYGKWGYYTCCFLAIHLVGISSKSQRIVIHLLLKYSVRHKALDVVDSARLLQLH